MRAGPCARLARIRLPMAVQYFFEGFPIPDGYPAPLKPEPSIHLPLVARPFLAYWTSASSIEYERANMKRHKIANKCSWRKNWNRLKSEPAWTFKTRLPNVSALSLRAISLERTGRKGIISWIQNRKLLSLKIIKFARLSPSHPQMCTDHSVNFLLLLKSMILATLNDEGQVGSVRVSRF